MTWPKTDWRYVAPEGLKNGRRREKDRRAVRTAWGGGQRRSRLAYVTEVVLASLILTGFLFGIPLLGAVIYGLLGWDATAGLR